MLFQMNKISMLDPWQPYIRYYEIDPVLELGRALFFMDTGYWDYKLCQILPLGQFWERVLLKHKCIQNL